jgi:hypothetical protein
MMMDVFIPEDYVRKRRLEKKLSATVSSTKGSQTHSHWNSNERIKDNKELNDNVFFPSNSDKGLTPLVDDHLFIYFSA